MLRMKDLPPMEREGNGSLYRMDAKQRREAVRLIRAHCGFYDNGNCLYLDDGEEVVCPQITSFSVICAFFRQVVLKDEAARGAGGEAVSAGDGKTLPCVRQDLFFDFQQCEILPRLPGGDAAKAEGCLCPEAEGKRRKVGL